jgi:CBS domain-containing protein
MEREPQDPWTEFKMAIAGPLCSLVIALFFFAATKLFYNLNAPMAVIVITDYLALLNVGVAIFNLIPGFPLDGGRVLRAGLWAYFKDLKKATRIASNFGKGFAYILMAFGLLNIFSTSFINGVWLIFIGLFLLEAAETSYQQVAMKNVLGGVRVKDIMTKDVVVVDAGQTLDKLVHDDFFRYRFTSFPVIENSSLIGLLTLHNVRDVAREKWPATTAKDAMVPLSDSILTNPDVEITDALSKMAGSGIGRLIVVEDHALMGILSQRDVMRLFEVRIDLEA